MVTALLTCELGEAVEESDVDAAPSDVGRPANLLERIGSDDAVGGPYSWDANEVRSAARS